MRPFLLLVSILVNILVSFSITFPCCPYLNKQTKKSLAFITSTKVTNFPSLYDSPFLERISLIVRPPSPHFPIQSNGIWNYLALQKGI